MERILLTTDFSEESTRAFAPAAKLAADLGKGLTLLSVVVDLKTAPQGAPLAPPMSAPSLGEEVEAAKDKMSGLLDTYAASFAGLADVATEVVASESIAQAILERAGKPDIAMIAISTHGRQGFRHLVLGSVTEEVCRAATVPVIVYPKG